MEKNKFTITFANLMNISEKKVQHVKDEMSITNVVYLRNV